MYILRQSFQASVTIETSSKRRRANRPRRPNTLAKYIAHEGRHGFKEATLWSGSTKTKNGGRGATCAGTTQLARSNSINLCSWNSFPTPPECHTSIRYTQPNRTVLKQNPRDNNNRNALIDSFPRCGHLVVALQRTVFGAPAGGRTRGGTTHGRARGKARGRRK